MVDIDLLVESDGLYMTTLPSGVSFTWRLLTLKEYSVFSGLREAGVLGEIQLHSDVFVRCYVGDHRAINGNLPAGIFLSLGRLIMYLSGDRAGSEAEEINAARSTYRADSVLELMKRVVIMAFAYQPHEIELWTRAKLTRNFVLAEAVLQNKTDYQPIDTSKIMSPGQAAVQRKKDHINYELENSELNKQSLSGEHILDQHPSALTDKSSGLSKKRLRWLDKR